MKKFTVDDIMAQSPCPDYTKNVVTELWNNKKSLSLDEILNLSIDISDRLWVLARLVPTETAIKWASYCAEEAQKCAAANAAWAPNAARSAASAADWAARSADWASAAARSAANAAARRAAHAAADATADRSAAARRAAHAAAANAANTDWKEAREKELYRLLEKLLEMDNELKTTKKD